MYNYLNLILVVTPGHALGVTLRGLVGVKTEHSHVAYQIKGDDEKNIKQLKYLPKGLPGALGRG